MDEQQTKYYLLGKAQIVSRLVDLFATNEPGAFLTLIHSGKEIMAMVDDGTGTGTRQETEFISQEELGDFFMKYDYKLKNYEDDVEVDFDSALPGWYQDPSANLYHFDGTKWDTMTNATAKSIFNTLEYLG